MSISAVTSSALQSLLDSARTPITTPNTGQVSTPTISSLSNLTGASSQAPVDPLTQDLVDLLKALASGDTASAKVDLAKLQKDIKSEEAGNGSGVTKGLTALLKDLASGNSTAAKSDLAQLKTGLTTQTSSVDSSSKTPLEKLTSKLSELLNSGSTDSALQAVASYLVQQGHGTGSLVNTSA